MQGAEDEEGTWTVRARNEHVWRHTRRPSNTGHFHFPHGPAVMCFSDLITKGSDNQCIHHLSNQSAVGTGDGKREERSQRLSGAEAEQALEMQSGLPSRPRPKPGTPTVA